MTNTKRMLAIVSVMLCCGSHTVLAQTSAQSTGSEVTTPTSGQNGVQSNSDAVSLRKTTENGVSYVCGGVGTDEAAEMKRISRDYDVLLTFATQRGNFLADVNVTITDAKGNAILGATCGAPMMLVDIPKAGTYKIAAAAEGKTLTRTATVRPKGRTQTVTLLWPQNVAGSDAAAPAARDSGR